MKKKDTCDKWLLLSWRKIWILVVSGFLAILIHNFWYAIFGFEEAVFFIYVVIIIPLYFLICFIYTLIKKIKDKSILKEKFISNLILGIIVASIVTALIIRTGFVNESAFWILTLILTILVYYPIKLIRGRK